MKGLRVEGQKLGAAQTEDTRPYGAARCANIHLYGFGGGYEHCSHISFDLQCYIPKPESPTNP